MGATADDVAAAALGEQIQRIKGRFKDAVAAAGGGPDKGLQNHDCTPEEWRAAVEAAQCGTDAAFAAAARAAGEVQGLHWARLLEQLRGFWRDQAKGGWAAPGAERAEKRLRATVGLVRRSAPRLPGG